MDEDEDTKPLTWLEALNRRLPQYRGRRLSVRSATVHKTQVPSGTAVDLANGWLFEERHTSHGNLALHLYPA